MVAIVTKVDKVSRDRVAEHLMKVNELGEFADLVPVSSVEGIQVDVLTDVLVKHLPKGPALYPTGEVTDEPEDVMIAELIREAALEGVHDELRTRSLSSSRRWSREGRRNDDRHAAAHHPRPTLRRARQPEGDHHRQGRRAPAEVGAEAGRHRALLGRKVYLDLHIKIAKEWQRDPKQLGRMGF